MLVKGITPEDFVNYKKPCMYICTAVCSYKCDKEANGNYCQNSSLASQESMHISDDAIISKYISNDITSAICFSGLEPFDQFPQILTFIRILREEYNCNDDVVIYTGYNKDEIDFYINVLKEIPNIIVKFGRFVPDQKSHFDEVLGVKLASPNQYAERIS